MDNHETENKAGEYALSQKLDWVSNIRQIRREKRRAVGQTDSCIAGNRFE